MVRPETWRSNEFLTDNSVHNYDQMSVQGRTGYGLKDPFQINLRNLVLKRLLHTAYYFFSGFISQSRDTSN